MQQFLSLPLSLSLPLLPLASGMDTDVRGKYDVFSHHGMQQFSLSLSLSPSLSKTTTRTRTRRASNGALNSTELSLLAHTAGHRESWGRPTGQRAVKPWPPHKRGGWPQLRLSSSPSLAWVSAAGLGRPRPQAAAASLGACWRWPRKAA